MKLVKYFDIHDKEVTPVVYMLFFALEELKGNDTVYKCWTESWDISSRGINYEYLNGLYQERLARGYQNCYRNRELMKQFCESPPTIQDAMKQCWDWLKEQGITDEDEFFLVKIWW